MKHNNSNRVVAIIEARMTSIRLPGKVLLKACGKPLLAHLIERLQRAESLDEVIVATTVNDTDDPIACLAAQLGIGCFRGSEHDVLGRVLNAANEFNVDTIVEITGDCPALDPKVVDICVAAFFEQKVHFLANRIKPLYPGGMDVRVFSKQTLKEVDLISQDDPFAREHVSLPITDNAGKYKIYSLEAPPELSMPELNIELDEPDDYKMIKTVFEALYPGNPQFDLSDIISYIKKNPGILEVNKNVARKDARE
jgi:spore coat polysaccharide biosynthesis protein SpsF